MRILWNNLWDLYALTESQEDAAYPVENTQDSRLAKVWRTATPSAANIKIDAGLGQLITCNSAAIIAHNFSSSATLAIQAATAPTWTVAFNTALTFREGTIVKYFDSQSFRCWLFSFSDNSNPDGYYEVGRLFLGAYLQVDPSSLVEFPEEHVRTDNQKFSRSNQLYADEGIGYKQLRYKFEAASASAKTLMEALWDGVGKHTPFLLMNYDETFTVIEPLYCAITENVVFQHKKYDLWDFELVLRECS